NLQFAGVSEVIRADLAQRTVTGAAAAFAIAHPDARALLRNNHKTAAVAAAGGRIFCMVSRAGLRMIGRWWQRVGFMFGCCHQHCPSSRSASLAVKKIRPGAS